MLKLGINARTLAAGKLRGWSRYTINLLEALQEYDVHFYLFSDKPFSDVFLQRLNQEKVTVDVRPVNRYFVWEQKVLREQCIEHGVDLLHCPINYGLPALKPCPTVLTLHDAITEKYYYPKASFKEKWFPGALLWRLSAKISHLRADRIITVSRHAKKDLIEFLKLPEHKIDVIYEAADPSFSGGVSSELSEAILEKHNIRVPYFFYVGGWEERKNIPFLLKAFGELDQKNVQLVLAGGSSTQKQKLKAEYSHLGDQLNLLEWVEEEELPTLYQQARAFIYPSEYEGFGLQVCEAMKMGTPVLVADRTSLPEIAGSGGLSFSLDQTDELVSLMKDVLDDSKFTAMKEKSKKRGEEFSWKMAAEQTWQTYQELLKANF